MPILEAAEQDESIPRRIEHEREGLPGGGIERRPGAVRLSQGEGGAYEPQGDDEQREPEADGGSGEATRRRHGEALGCHAMAERAWLEGLVSMGGCAGCPSRSRSSRLGFDSGRD